MWNVKSGFGNVGCADVGYRMWNVECQMWNVECAMWNVGCELWNVK